MITTKIYKEIKESKTKNTHVKFVIHYDKGVYTVTSTPVTRTKEDGKPYVLETFECYQGFREKIKTLIDVLRNKIILLKLFYSIK